MVPCRSNGGQPVTFRSDRRGQPWPATGWVAGARWRGEPAMPLPKSATARRWPSKATGWQYWCAAASVTQSCAAASASGIGPMINLSSAAGLAVLACGDHRIEVIEQARIVVLGRMPERSQAFEIRGAADIDTQSGGWKRLGRGRT